MASQHTGNKAEELVVIETDKILFIIKGRRKLDDEKLIEEGYEGVTYKCFYGEVIGEVSSKAYFYEYENYEIIIENKASYNIEFYHENKNIRDGVGYVGRKSKLLSGIINFRGDIGRSDIIIYVDGREHLNVTLEVFPSKLDYKKDYYDILHDVNEEIYNLSFEFLKRTYLSTKLTNKSNKSLTEYYSILNMIYENLIKALKVIINMPHHSLEKERSLVGYHKIKNVDTEMIKWLEKRPDKLVYVKGKILPIEAMQVKKTLTLDTYENRYLKYMLNSIIRKLIEFKSKYEKYKGMRDNKNAIDDELIKTIEAMVKKINSYINRSFLKNVSRFEFKQSSTLVFTMAPGYREVYKYYLMLKKGLTLKGEVFRLSMKELSLLYEYWCFIKINSLLRKKYKLISSDMMRIDKDGIFVTLKKGTESKVTYEDNITGERFTILYNSKMKSKTIGQKPDNVLCINKEGGALNYNYIFDAKYKIDRSSEYCKTYSTPGPKEEDINTMHKYRDAIIHENKDKVKKNIFGAFVLFPYSNEEEYKNHDLYKSIDEVNIGGIPFLPSATKLMEEFLDELIGESYISSFERALEQKGKDYIVKTTDFTNREVLFGTLSSKEQLEINLKNKFYHTKLSNVNLAKHSIKTIAIVQSGKFFGKEEAGIKYYGSVKEIKIVKRSDIKEIPKDCDEMYIRFEIEEWKTLNNKIEIKGFPVTRPMYTSNYLLYNAQTIAELCIKSEEEFRLWKEIKNLQMEFDTVVESDNSSEDNSEDIKYIKGFTFGDKEIYIADNKIKVNSKCNGVLVSEELDLEEFRRRPGRVVRRIV